MAFRISGLSPEPFQHLFGLPDEGLEKHKAIRIVADGARALTDRIEMRDARPGETVLLVNHVCQPAETPYHASHAIFVLEGAVQPWIGAPNEIPDVMLTYLQSLRGFDDAGMLIDADVAIGDAVRATIERLFANPAIAYILAHNAKQGCYAGRIDRLPA